MRIATDFARLGWRVGVAARRVDRLETLRDLYPDNIEYAGIDVTAPDAVDRFLDLIQTLDGMDILLYAAGCGWSNPELDLTDDLQTIGVNVTGMTRMVNAAYRYYRQTANVTRGRIAVITSVAGTKGIGPCAAYSASKRYQWTYLQALDQLARQQRVNVDFTDIRPGFVDTDLIKGRAGSLPMVMSVDYAAPRIERAILRGDRIATIDSRWAIVTGLWRLVPGCLWRRIGLDF